MAFHNVIFPEDIAYNSAFGPSFNTNIIQLSSGLDQRVGRWTGARRVYNAAYNIRTYEKLAIAAAFIIERNGSENTFPFLDFMDCTTASTHRHPSLKGTPHAADDVNIGTGDGLRVDFQMFKEYDSGPVTVVRNITKPRSGTVLVELNGGAQTEGVDYTVNYVTGIITFNTAPPASQDVTFGCQFNVPVRFSNEDDELFQVTAENFSAGSIEILLVEDLEDNPEDAGDFFAGGSIEYAAGQPNTTLSLANGQTVVFLRDTAGAISATLPAAADIPSDGGPIFTILHAGSDGVIDIKVGATTLTSLTAGQGVQIFLTLDAATGQRTWRALS